MKEVPKKAAWIGTIDNSEVMTAGEETTIAMISIHLSCPCSLI